MYSGFILIFKRVNKGDRKSAKRAAPARMHKTDTALDSILALLVKCYCIYLRVAQKINKRKSGCDKFK
jgi:hypothetical protein